MILTGNFRLQPDEFQLFFVAERFGIFGNIVPLSVAIFSFLKKKRKGFTLQSGLKREILLFCQYRKKEKHNNQTNTNCIFLNHH
jgi:hypothetical protein